ncbi:hypothetical protein [Burkholderia glumae]|uniref:hypothetical protein n=1 Tax=Burkholderia glumae TaxID=337 RepID=UPI002037293B|nr:hypothetical protein [Burkholderia glumae]MCM2546222.1 hypothetical protein [Burkholderia glumae]
MTDPSTARSLAIGWFRSQLRIGKFGDEIEPKWAVLHAEIAANDDEFYDCNTVEFREALFTYLKALGRATDEPYSEDDLNGAYNTLIKRVEEKCERSFRVISTCVPLPSKMALKEKIAGGDPFVYIVRNGLQDLQIIHREDEPIAEAEVNADAKGSAACGR